jgi:hypothetical protein
MNKENKEDEGAEFFKELKEAFIDLRERFEIEESNENDRELYAVIAEFPIIGTWKEKAKQLDIHRAFGRRRNKLSRSQHLIGLEQHFEIPMTKHHVNERDVVYIPTHIHASVRHKVGDRKLEGVVG